MLSMCFPFEVGMKFICKIGMMIDGAVAYSFDPSRKKQCAFSFHLVWWVCKVTLEQQKKMFFRNVNSSYWAALIHVKLLLFQILSSPHQT